MTAIAREDWGRLRSPAPDAIVLDRLKVAATRVLPHGLQDLRVTADYLEVVAEGVALRMAAHVLSDAGGEPVTATVTATRKARPRWVPRRLWDRLPEETATTSVSATPRWTYPHATLAVPALGAPVRVLVRDTPERTGWTYSPG